MMIMIGVPQISAMEHRVLCETLPKLANCFGRLQINIFARIWVKLLGFKTV